MVYKRNQVDEAFAALFGPKAGLTESDLRTRIRRLLETDRALGQIPRAKDPTRAHYAFYSAEPQGSGTEVWFSDYEAFALLNALRLMNHGWVQSLAVSIMRRVRPELEREHARILKQSPAALFDQEAIRRAAREGGWAVDNTDPVFLTIVSNTGQSPDGSEPLPCAIRRGVNEANRWGWEASKRIGGVALFEIATQAHTLATRLRETTPRSRGRRT
jgi:hypothetical protein